MVTSWSIIFTQPSVTKHVLEELYQNEALIIDPDVTAPKLHLRV